jgi:hypothetical protein
MSNVYESTGNKINAIKHNSNYAYFIIFKRERE